MRTAGSTGPHLQTVERAADVLALFSAELPELGLTQIAFRLGVSKPTAHRLAQTLASVGLLEQDPDTKRYRLGLRILELARVVRAGEDVRTRARPDPEPARTPTTHSRR